MGVIIGLSGQARVGKDTFADYLVRNYRFYKIGLADPMKRFCKEIFDFTDEQLYGDKRDAPDPRYVRRVVIDGPNQMIEWLTPRYALQTLGTEWGRHCHNNVWIDYGLKMATTLLAGYATYTEKDGIILHEKDVGEIGGVIFSDLRFRNEFDAVRAQRGKMIRIYRPGYTGAVGISGHASEAEQKTIQDQEFDTVIVNHEGLDTYYRTIDSMMGTLGLQKIAA
jgi:hypothetical protein